MRLHISWPLIVATLEKFTLSFLCGLIALGLIVYGNHHPLFMEQAVYIKLLITIGVFVPLIVSSERAGVMKGSMKIRLLGSVTTIVIALLYAFCWLPDMNHIVQVDRYAIQIALHVFLTWTSLLWIVPTMMKRNAKDTWAHVYKLILDILITGIFCGVLFGGLSAAMGAIDYLFNVTIDGKWFGDLAAIVFLGFGVLFCLSHLATTPTVYTYTKETFPKVLRIFAEYILGFLLLIYAIILLAYTFKIVVSGVWPNGMVAMLIFGFVGMGMVYSAILLPRTIDTPNGHLRSRILGAAFIGCAILLVAALHLRVAQYGWTVKRTFVVLIAIWIIVLAISLLIVRPSIKWWVVSAAVLVLLSLYSPINIFSVGKNDQLVRLTSELSSLGITKPGDKATTSGSTQTTQNISSRVDYILTYHGTGALAQFVSPEGMIPKVESDNPDNYASNSWTIGTAIMSAWGLSYEPNVINEFPGEGTHRINYYAQNPSNIDIDGYSELFFIAGNNTETLGNSVTTIHATTGGNEKTSYQLDFASLMLSVGGAQKVSLSPIIEQAKLLQNIQDPKQSLSTPLILTGDNFALYITSLDGEYRLNGNGSGEVFNLTNLQGILLAR